MKMKCYVIVLAACLLSGCAMGNFPPMFGTLYTNNSGPLAVTSNEIGTKVGMAKSTSILAVCFGDSTINTAAQNGGITKITSVDAKLFHILGVYAEYTTIVRGD